MKLSINELFVVARVAPPFSGPCSIGFTGTREGMAPAQRFELHRRLRNFDRFFGHYHHFHHGACVGSDAQAVAIAHVTLVAVYVAHPSDMPHATDAEALALSGEHRAPLPPLVRNRNIVDASEIIFAAPRGFAEEQRSGTWATVRYARKLFRPLTIIWPDGTVSEENQ